MIYHIRLYVANISSLFKSLTNLMVSKKTQIQDNLNVKSSPTLSHKRCSHISNMISLLGEDIAAICLQSSPYWTSPSACYHNCLSTFKNLFKSLFIELTRVFQYLHPLNLIFYLTVCLWRSGRLAIYSPTPCKCSNFTRQAYCSALPHRFLSMR